MNDNYIVKVTEQAEAQLNEIVNYIAFHFQSPASAAKILDTLESAIVSLDQLQQL